ncbi:hypothetical protein ACP275_02G132800 [Erythranthe tilingii]
MESNLQKSPKLGNPADTSDAKYVSGLSTILVATIQEAKDRISQIEYIFCSQLFPNFQTNFQSLQKILSEAREAAESEYKDKEKDLLLQIEKLQCQKQQVLEENRSLKREKDRFINMEGQSCNRFMELQNELKQKTAEANEVREAHQNLQKLLESKLHSNERTIKELEEKNSVHLKMQKKLEVDIDELRLELMKKSKEVDEVMELQNKLLQVNQSKASLIVQKEIQLKNHEEKIIGLISKLKNIENNVYEMESELRDKTKEVEKGKELQGNLLKKMEFQASEIMNNEELLNKYEKENQSLAAKIESLVSRTDELQKELGRKNSELEEFRKMKGQFVQQSGSFNFGNIKKEQSLEEFDEERKRLLDKQKYLEDKVEKLEKGLSDRIEESSEGMELHGKLLQQIQVKDSDLQSEKRKKRDAIVAYKKLKSEYNYLLKKYALTQETMLPPDKMGDESETVRHYQNDIDNHTSKVSGTASDVIKPVNEQELLEGKKEVPFVQKSSPVSPSTSNIPVAPRFPSSVKTCPPAGAKRPLSYWRDTRSHQSRVGPDPHDDFLDTPLENVRGNLGKMAKQNIPEVSKPNPADTTLDNSETQDMDADAEREMMRTSPPPKAGASGFKYVEPVRKKFMRDNLKGVECKQCKKFYDAVLPGAGGENSKQNNRCEHHEGVSRHRYRGNAIMPPSFILEDDFPPYNSEYFQYISSDDEDIQAAISGSRVHNTQEPSSLNADQALKSDIFTKHFYKVTLPSGLLQAKCRYCPNAYKFKKGGGYGSLKRHVKKKHPTEFGIDGTQTQMLI